MTATKTLYHGSPDATLATVLDSGTFGGVFAGSERTARSHGEHVYEIELDESDICTSYYLNYEADYETVAAAIEAEGRDADEAWDAVIEGASLDDADEDWEMQRIRGCVARALGFRAVECSDEHGTSWLVLPGVALRKVAG
jgi:hypothetical protein